MFGKKKEKEGRPPLDMRDVCCPLCKSKSIDGRVYGEGGRFVCLKCGAIFTIEAIPKK